MKKMKKTTNDVAEEILKDSLSEIEAEEAMEENVQKIVADPLLFQITSLLNLKERILTPGKVRQTHLAKQNKVDPLADRLLERHEETKKMQVQEIAKLLKSHPAYNWFSHVKGVGPETIAQVIYYIDINKAPNVSSLWKYAGYHVDKDGKAPKLQKGQKPDWNTILRSMCWRLGKSILKTCNRKGSKFYNLYVNTLNNYVAEYTNKGIKIIAAADMKKGVNGKREEVQNTITKGHVQNQALRKMIKIFLQCLWLVWREAEGLPVTEPYVKSHLGHQHILTPWEMTDADKKKQI